MATFVDYLGRPSQTEPDPSTFDGRFPGWEAFAAEGLPAGLAAPPAFGAPPNPWVTGAPWHLNPQTPWDIVVPAGLNSVPAMPNAPIPNEARFWAGPTFLDQVGRLLQPGWQAAQPANVARGVRNAATDAYLRAFGLDPDLYELR